MQIEELNDWGGEAQKAITENPRYFVWWYTVKSVGLGVVAAGAAYLLGRLHASQPPRVKFQRRSPRRR